MLTGETTIYGRIIRVGGKTPKVMLDTVDGRTIDCDADASIAQTLGGRLYQVVGLLGIAEWDPQTLTIDTFQIKALLPYEAKPLKEAMAQLAAITRKYYADIDDVPKYIASIRDPGEVSGQNVD